MDVKQIARTISLIENEADGYLKILESLSPDTKKVIGITGPPGAGKSTITDALIGEFINAGKKVAVICIDPSSPFNRGAILGDRIRMSRWYNNGNVFIRSLATRGAVGGLNAKIIEITDFMKSTDYDMIIVETVGVGQSEIDIVGLADITVVVLVPEAGDEVQTMKAGLMEIADVFVVNKSDRPGADIFVKNLRQLLGPAFKKQVPVISTIASQGTGIDQLAEAINNTASQRAGENHQWLLAEKAYQLIQKERMKDVSKEKINADIDAALRQAQDGFNLYRFVKRYLNN